MLITMIVSRNLRMSMVMDIMGMGRSPSAHYHVCVKEFGNEHV